MILDKEFKVTLSAEEVATAIIDYVRCELSQDGLYVESFKIKTPVESVEVLATGTSEI